jgi:hypothetical protein
MNVTVDAETERSLGQIKSSRLQKVVGIRYPNPLSYYAVHLHTDRGILAITLRSVVVSSRLEVSCISTGVLAESAIGTEAIDEIYLADFRIDRILIWRRAEWLVPAASDFQGIGGDAYEHVISHPADLSPADGTAIVDSGVELIDQRGIGLALHADSFPLVLRLNLSVSPDQLSPGESRAL